MKKVKNVILLISLIIGLYVLIIIPKTKTVYEPINPYTEPSSETEYIEDPVEEENFKDNLIPNFSGSAYVILLR
ncbi:hypothetical protein [Sporanaerobacter sp. PP17-6a]|jgi:hypothetical protein|uniref:hypothetical protein n=1 Tax=Sporanaerobacter sp. PP17-6a TaxID=1891289 RepID=UPI00089FBA49|nr:hypothetical protein [Sporanaerobacter sp. PP17-6a]SCL86534.1 hypothetical protein PP176A_1106 [Sporanaerobacter sp. PP17-6a]